MRRNATLTASLIVTILLFLAGCNKGSNGGRTVAPETTSAPVPTDGVRRISVAEAQAELEKGEAVLMDARGEVEYKLGHIKSAVSIPLGLIGEHAKELPQGKLIVTYCACTHEQLSVRACQELKKAGIENTAALLGGWDEWKRVGLPTE